MHGFSINKKASDFLRMGKRGKLQTNLEYAAARAALGGLGALPRSAAVRIGRSVGQVAYSLGGNLRRTGERNLELAFPEKSAEERARILRGSFISLGRLLGEFSRFPRHTPESLSELVEYRDIDQLRAAQSSGRGIIFLTLHLGAWEILSFAHSALHDPLSFMVRRLDNPRVEEMIEGMRTRFGNQAIDKKAAVRTALRILREGGTLGILADLNTQPQEGVFVPFFGIPACTTAGAAMLALRTNAIVLPVCAPWDEKEGRYTFRGLTPMEVVRTGDNEEDVRTNTARFTAAIEQFVREYPDQWLWVHKRWRTRPEGEADLYNLSGAPSSQLSSTSPKAAQTNERASNA